MSIGEDIRFHRYTLTDNPLHRELAIFNLGFYPLYNNPRPVIQRHNLPPSLSEKQHSNNIDKLIFICKQFGEIKKPAIEPENEENTKKMDGCGW
jgi:hypothetical protein